MRPYGWIRVAHIAPGTAHASQSQVSIGHVFPPYKELVVPGPLKDAQLFLMASHLFCGGCIRLYERAAVTLAVESWRVIKAIAKPLCLVPACTIHDLEIAFPTSASTPQFPLADLR